MTGADPVTAPADRYRRADVGAILPGDKDPDGGVVAAFGFLDRPAATYLPGYDVILLEGDDPGAMPDRRAPRTLGPGWEACGETAIERAAGLLSDAPAAVVAGARELLARRPSGSVASSALRALSRGGHQGFLSGGAVRDLVAGQAPATVNDLDLAGTAPPAWFHDAVTDQLRRDGDGDTHLLLGVSWPSLVCWALPVDDDERLIEYRPLQDPRWAFPASGADVVADASLRDLTFNALHLDPETSVLIDATGAGVADLRAVPRVLRTPLAVDGPGVQIGVVLRTLKFVLRYEGMGIAVDCRPVQQWMDDLSADALDRCGEADRLRLAHHADAILGSPVPEAVRRRAAELHPWAARLVDTLAARAADPGAT